MDKARIILLMIVVFFGGAVTYKIIAETRASSNDVMAQLVLKKVSAAMEQYRSRNGAYPLSIDSVIIEDYPYRANVYFRGSHYGYQFTSSITRYDYTLTAEPAPDSDNPGQYIYTITTGGELRQE